MNELNKEIPSQTGGDLSFFFFVFLSHGLLCTGTTKAWLGGLGELALKSGDTESIQYINTSYSNNSMTSSTTNLTFWTCPGTALLYGFSNLSGTVRWDSESGSQKTGSLEVADTFPNYVILPGTSVQIHSGVINTYGYAMIDFTDTGVLYTSSWKSSKNCWLKNISIDIFALYV